MRNAQLERQFVTRWLCCLPSHTFGNSLVLRDHRQWSYRSDMHWCAKVTTICNASWEVFCIGCVLSRVVYHIWFWRARCFWCSCKELVMAMRAQQLCVLLCCDACLCGKQCSCERRSGCVLFLWNREGRNVRTQPEAAHTEKPPALSIRCGGDLVFDNGKPTAI